MRYAYIVENQNPTGVACPACYYQWRYPQLLLNHGPMMLSAGAYAIFTNLYSEAMQHIGSHRTRPVNPSGPKRICHFASGRRDNSGQSAQRKNNFQKDREAGTESLSRCF